MLQAEVGHAEDGEVVELPLGKERGRAEDGEQDLHEREQIRVFGRQQIGERLDRTVSDALPENVVFRTNFLLSRMSRPFDSKCSEQFHSDFDSAVRAVGGVERRPEARDGGELCRADRKQSQS
jgi:hypothetical protein